MRAGSQGRESVKDGILANQAVPEQGRSGGVYVVEIEREGKVIETFEVPNLIVNEGLNYKRDVALLAGTQISSWFLALIDGSPTIDAGDTYATQAGWDEVTAYDEANRPGWTGASDTVGVATNSGNEAEFTISTGGATVGGVALVGGGTDADTKGDAAGGGTLFSASAFGGGDRALQEGDVLRITWQHTDSDAS